MASRVKVPLNCEWRTTFRCLESFIFFCFSSFIMDLRMSRDVLLPQTYQIKLIKSISTCTPCNNWMSKARVKPAQGYSAYLQQKPKDNNNKSACWFSLQEITLMGRERKGMGPKGFFAFEKDSNSRSRLHDIGGFAQPIFYFTCLQNRGFSGCHKKFTN